jgi:hypothetical protein
VIKMSWKGQRKDKYKTLGGKHGRNKQLRRFKCREKHNIKEILEK